MGTAKRERKKANRQLQQYEMARQAQRDRLKRRTIRIGIGVVVVVGAIFLISRAFSGGGDDTVSPAVTDAPVAQTQPPATEAPPVTTEAPPDTVAPGPPITGDTPCPPEDHSAPRTISFENPPPNCLEDGATYQAEVTTNLGTFTIDLDAERAPLTVNNFVVLARYQYFDGTVCHRAIPDFVVQCGDPTATGTGGPGYQFDDELPEAGEYEIGSLAMANSGPNTNGSQFFVITGDNGAALPPQYSLFGSVSDGMDTVADMDALGNPGSNGVPPLGLIAIESVRIIQS